VRTPHLLLGLVATLACHHRPATPTYSWDMACGAVHGRSLQLDVQFEVPASFTCARSPASESWTDATRADGHWRGFGVRVQTDGVRPSLAPVPVPVPLPLAVAADSGDFILEGPSEISIGCSDCPEISAYERHEVQLGSLEAVLETAVEADEFEHHMVLLTWRRPDGTWAVVQGEAADRRDFAKLLRIVRSARPVRR
jgi:hypothetical protein